LAAESGVSGVTIRNFENGKSDQQNATRRTLEQTLAAAGSLFIPQNGGGAGVRLRHPSK